MQSTLGKFEAEAPFGYIANDYDIDIQAWQVDFEAICAVTGEPFVGKVYVALVPGERCVEYCSFEDWIKSLETQVCTHEELTRYIYDALTVVLKQHDHLIVNLWVAVQVREAAHIPATTVIGTGFIGNINFAAAYRALFPAEED